MNPFELGSWYLAYRLCPRCIYPINFRQNFENVWLNYVPFYILAFCIVKQHCEQNVIVFSEKPHVPQHPNHSFLIMTCCDLENVVHIIKHKELFVLSQWYPCKLVAFYQLVPVICIPIPRCDCVHRSFTMFRDRWTSLPIKLLKADIFHLEFIEN